MIEGPGIEIAWGHLDEASLAAIASRETVHSLFEQQVARSPSAEAVVFEDETVTYGQLNRRASALAHRLRRQGVTAEVMVGIRMERSIEMMVGLLGILKAGGAYVPVDPAYPAERTRFLLEDSGVAVLLTQARLLKSLPAVGCHTIVLDAGERSFAAEEASNPGATAGSRNLAYMIYTSGSTGKPKGAMNEHRGIINRLLWQQTVRPLAPGDSVLQKTTFSFDVSVWELFLPLLAGARLVMARPGGQQDPDYLIRTIREQRITLVHFVPSMLRMFLTARDVETCTGIEHIMCSGEALPADVVETCHRKLPATVHNLYGPTEAAVEVTYWECPRDWPARTIPIGRPIANTRLPILKENLEIVAPGEAGELHIGGIQVSRGYHRRPELTRERFIRDPFDASPEARLYKTGDLARMREDGAIEYLGRIDHQVKIRGHRVELGEIETVLNRHPAVRAAVVAADEDDSALGPQSLTASLVLADGSDPSVRGLREHLLSFLPEYMVPGTFRVIECIPHLHSGKIDRNAVARSAARLLPSDSTYIEPETGTERTLAEIWAQALGLERVGLDDDFIELGGHSLLAVQVATAVNGTWDIGLTLAHVLSAGTVRALGREVEKLQGSPSLTGPGDLAQVGRTGPLPLSSTQRHILLESLREPGIPIYNEPCTIRFGGAVDTRTLERALNEVIRRHEILRTTYAILDGEPLQMVAPVASITIPMMDLREVPPCDRERVAEERATSECARPFDLALPPLIRATLMILGADDWRLQLTIHHIACDTLAIFDVLAAEMRCLYRAFTDGELPALPEPPFQYVDFVDWQTRKQSGTAVDRQVAFWREKLSGAEGTMLRGDRPRPPVFSYRGARVSFTVPRETTAAIHAQSRSKGTTSFVILLAAFMALLHRETGEDDVVLGTVTSGRDLAVMRRMFGCFLNYVVLRSDLSGNPAFSTLLGRVKATVLEATARQDVPLGRLAEALQPARATDRHPFYQIMFLMEPPGERSYDGWPVSQLEFHPGTTKLDLTFALDEIDGRFVGRVEYCTDIFDRSTIDRLASGYLTLLESVARDPSARVSSLPVLSAGERRKIVHDFNRATFPHPRDVLLHQLIELQAANDPDRTAVTCEKGSLTYRELLDRARRMARHLSALGVGPDTPVAVCLERSCDLLVAILGVLEAGGAFVPVDVTYPPERIASMLADARPPVVITRTGLLAGLPVSAAKVVDIERDREVLLRCPNTPVLARTTPDNLAYIIYTSGSTGEPKGVMIPHGAICNHMLWMQRAYPLRADDAVLQKTACSFDASIWEFFAPLLAGARLFMARPGDPHDPLYLASTIKEHGITRLQLVPSVLNMLLAEKDFAQAQLLLRDVFCGGEELTPALCHAFSEAFPDVALHNLYGPAEATIDATAWDCGGGPGRATVPIGRTIDNLRAYVVDKYMNPVPVGATGELLLGGAGVARGYLNRPDLTRERFIPDPFSDIAGERVYRTGDLARFRPDGVLEFLGRNDTQLKIRGIRIEPAEIEAALTHLPGVARAAVVAFPDSNGEKQLSAYVAPRDKSDPPDPHALAAALRRVLPRAWIPANITILATLPLGPSGKLDRKSLPRPAVIPGSAATFEAGDDPLAGVLAAIWCDVIGIQSLDPSLSFFELGGHSLQAIRLLSRVRSTLETDVPLPEFLRHATFAALAECICERRLSQASRIRPGKVTRPASLPLTSSQRQMWLLQSLDSTGTGHNVISVLRMSGALDVPALELALGSVVARHEAFRTVFPMPGGEPVQVVEPPDDCPTPGILRVTSCEGQSLETALASALSQENRRRFDLEAGPLFSARLVSDGRQEHALVLNLHHIIADEPSEEIVFRDVAHAYSRLARPGDVLDPMPEVGLCAADFAVWESAPERKGELQRRLAWWRQTLAGASPMLELPTDQPRPLTQAFRGKRTFHAVDTEVSAEIDRLSREAGATPFMLFLVAWSSFLRRLCGQEEVVLGAPLSLRSLGALEHTVGFFINTLPFRIAARETDSFRTLIGHVRSVTLDVYAHAYVPFDTLVETLQPARIPGVPPIYQVMLVMRGAASPAPSMPGIHTAIVDHHPDSAKVDLSLLVAERAGRYELALEYREDLFEPLTVEAWLGDFAKHLHCLVARPDAPIGEAVCVSDAEGARLLAFATGAPLARTDGQTLVSLLDDAARAHAFAPALCHTGGAWLDHEELARASTAWARTLRRRPGQEEPRVGICFERSPSMIMAITAALRAGAAYVPLDPNWPPARLEWTIMDSGVNIVLTGTGTAADRVRESIPAGCGVEVVEMRADADPEIAGPESGDASEAQARPSSLAYVIYTSGSTGRPKGVLVEHAQVVASTLARNDVYGGSPARFLLLSPAVFDSSVAGIFWTLTGGGALVLPPPGLERDPAALAQVIVEERITHYLCLPSLHALLLNELREKPASLAAVVVAGESCPLGLPALHREVLPGVKLFNEYGPTEATVWCTVGDITDEGSGSTVPIGRPIPNAHVHLVDGALRLVPRGAVGEVVVAGAGIARGYHERTELTRERFVEGPFSGFSETRIYRTGDLGRWLPDGRLEFCGRRDEQLKVRGHRIEPGEIESAILGHPSVREVAVAGINHGNAGTTLVAHVSGFGKNATGTDALKDYLRNRLPEPMIPAFFVFHDALPRTATGKIDRRNLPAPVTAGDGRRTGRVAPRTTLEATLQHVWERVLGVAPVGIRDDFFDLGGHSLLAVKLAREIERATSRRVGLSTILLARTVEDMARRLSASEAVSLSSGPADLRGTGRGATLFNIPGYGGVGVMPKALADRIARDRRYFDGLVVPGVDGAEPPLDKAEEIASKLVIQIRSVQPHGPYALTGFCLGGIFAYEVAQQLTAAGEEVRALALWHAFPLQHWQTRNRVERLGEAMRRIKSGNGTSSDDFLPQVLPYYSGRARHHLAAMHRWLVNALGIHSQPSAEESPWQRAQARAGSEYHMQPYTGRILVVRATRFAISESLLYELSPAWGWEQLARGPFELADHECDHMDLIREPRLSQVVEQTASWLCAADEACAASRIFTT